MQLNLSLSFEQVVELTRQLPHHERIKPASILTETDNLMSKEELVSKINEGLQDAKLHKEGKIKLRTLNESLADV